MRIGKSLILFLFFLVSNKEVTGAFYYAIELLLYFVTKKRRYFYLK